MVDVERCYGWTRRRFGLTAGGLAASVTRLRSPADAAATKKRKKPLRRNAFGCVDVGEKCRGADSVCCSGICQGKKPKKGQKDTSRCIAHDAGICQPGQGSTFCGGSVFESCESSTGEPGECETTTGKVGYCVRSQILCSPCAKDADCVPQCGADAACIRCVGCGAGTACVGPGSAS